MLASLGKQNTWKWINKQNTFTHQSLSLIRLMRTCLYSSENREQGRECGVKKWQK